MSDTRADVQQTTATPPSREAPVFEGLHPVFGEAIEPESTRYALDQPWVAEGWLYASDGRMAVRVPVASLPAAVVALYDVPAPNGGRRPYMIGDLFDDYERHVAVGRYEDEPTALPDVPSPYRPCPDCLDAAGSLVQCPTCDGEGEADCDECEGDGVVVCDMDHEHDCDECDGEGSVECEDCDGTGKCVCQGCEGTRLVEDKRAVTLRAEPFYAATAFAVGKLRRAGIAAAWLPKEAETRIEGSRHGIENPIRLVFDAASPGDGLGQGWVMGMSPDDIEHARQMGDDIDYPEPTR